MFWSNFLRILDISMPTPQPYGFFHIASLLLTVVFTVLLCITQKKEDSNHTNRIVFAVAVLVSLLELYKQINYSFSYADGISFDYQWYAFPFQFCSMPMYVGLLIGLFRRGKIHDALLAFLATYALFGGLCVMFYPVSVFTGTVGINIQTMVCHGSMVSVGIYLFYSGAVKPERRTILRALPVFLAAVLCAMLLNEIAFFSGLLEQEDFNMFFISRHEEPSLPVYSLVQQYIPFPFCLLIYIAGFSAASYLILLAAKGIAVLYRRIASRHSIKSNELCN